LRPTKEQLAAAANQTLPDVIAPDLDVLFCGINPALYTAAVQQNFGRPGNRFWPVCIARDSPRFSEGHRRMGSGRASGLDCFKREARVVT
jgi:hypothetical protein